ncbi:MAG: hypothetical protein Q8L98_04445 [Chlamydiales bacterium]|nr:hypothetical protein [Chlamydiales bacterium]
MMKSRREIVLQAFLGKLPPEKREKLETFLPEELRYSPQEETHSNKEPSKDLFEQIHWSWFLPTLKTYAEKEQQCFLAALPKDVADNISASLHITPLSEPLTQSANSYLLGLLKSSLIPSSADLLPQEYLPASPLNQLLSITKKQFIELLQLLGLHDLAVELRQIVDTKTLKKLHSFITEKEHKRIKELSSYQKNSLSPRQLLDRWDGEEESLRILLHRRGLIRLGAALQSQHPDLIWHICHQLDIGRGSSLLKLCSQETPSTLSESIFQEIDDLIRNYL